MTKVWGQDRRICFLILGVKVLMFFMKKYYNIFWLLKGRPNRTKSTKIAVCANGNTFDEILKFFNVSAALRDQRFSDWPIYRCVNRRGI